MYRALQSKPRRTFTPKTYAIQHIRAITMCYHKPPKDIQTCYRGAYQLVEECDADGKMSTLTISSERFVVSDLVAEKDYIYNIQQVCCVGLETKSPTKCALVVWDGRQGVIVHIFDCQLAANLMLDAKAVFDEAVQQQLPY